MNSFIIQGESRENNSKKIKVKDSLNRRRRVVQNLMLILNMQVVSD
jgi:hypothetical protein